MAKPKPERVPSDDCPATIGGAVCYPHEGEWVEAFRVREVRDNRDQMLTLQLQAEIDAVKGDDDEVRKQREILDRHYEGIIEGILGRITAWSWTDLRSKPLGAPTVESLRRLSTEELYWLWQVVRGETPTEEKKGLSDLETTSAATPSDQPTS